MTGASDTVWALVQPGGAFVIRRTDGRHPAEAGHEDECAGVAVFRLPREPEAALGEGVDPVSGSIDFSAIRAGALLIPAIKAAAAARIADEVPVWRQLNDLAEPGAPGAAARRARVRAIRDWSDGIEAELLAAREPRAVRDIMARVRAFERGEG